MNKLLKAYEPAHYAFQYYERRPGFAKKKNHSVSYHYLDPANIQGTQLSEDKHWV